MKPEHIKVYRKDNPVDDLELVALVDGPNGRICHRCQITAVVIPEWKHAHIIIEHPIGDIAELIDGTATALGGWHFLLDSEAGDMDEIVWEGPDIEEALRRARIVEEAGEEEEPPDLAVEQINRIEAPGYSELGEDDPYYVYPDTEEEG